MKGYNMFQRDMDVEELVFDIYRRSFAARGLRVDQPGMIEEWDGDWYRLTNCNGLLAEVNYLTHQVKVGYAARG